MAGCKLLAVYNQELYAVKYINSAILLNGGAKQSAFARFNSTMDCLGHISTIKMSDEFGMDWNTEILLWARQVEEDSNTEKQIEQQISVAKDTIYLLGDDPDATVDCALYAAELEEALSNFRKGMHLGFFFIGDIVDMRTSVRQITFKNQAKDHHMYQICAYQNGVSGNNLGDRHSKGAI